MARTAEISRNTTETQIAVRLDLDGTGAVENHHRNRLPRPHADGPGPPRACSTSRSRAEGDLHIDYHHTTEDVGIVLGQALAQAVGDKRGIRRYGQAAVPMDEALVEAAVDISGRPFLAWYVAFARDKVGEMDTELFEEFFRALAMNGLLTLHMTQTRRHATPTTSPKPASRPSPGRSAGDGAGPARRRRNPLDQGGAVRIYTAHARKHRPRRPSWCGRA